MYAAFLWIFIISQFFAYKWITTNGDSFNSLMGYTQKEDVVTMTVDELIGTIAKTAVAEIKK